MEDTIWWKITFEGRQYSLEDNFQWKTPFYGRQLSKEEELWWKKTFNGRVPLIENNHCWKTTFNGIKPSLEEARVWHYRPSLIFYKNNVKKKSFTCTCIYASWGDLHEKYPGSSLLSYKFRFQRIWLGLVQGVLRVISHELHTYHPLVPLYNLGRLDFIFI